MTSASRVSNRKEDSSAPQEDIWLSILSRTAETRNVPIKTIMLLGDPQSGKTTLIHHFNVSSSMGSTTLGMDETAMSNWMTDNIKIDINKHNQDLGLCYSYIEVNDEENEDISVRLSFYQLSDANPSHTSLLQIPISPLKLRDTAVIITLDWSKPWSLVEQLERWLGVLENMVLKVVEKEKQLRKESRNSNVGEYTGLDIDWYSSLKEKLQIHVQSYIEPLQPNAECNEDAKPQSTDLSSHSVADQEVLLPLGEGVLTRNLGIPVFIVCCKSDIMTTLECEAEFKEAKFDFIQQALRTIALQYGASLFYTSPSHTNTFATLRSYILHRMLNSYPFNQRAQIVERDTVFVPTGWDSWGKIKLLREEFVPNVFNLPDLPIGQVNMQEAKISWQNVVGMDTASQAAPIPTVSAEDEQTFLERQLEAMNKQATIVNSSSSIVPSVSSISSFLQSSSLPASPSLIPSSDSDDIAARLARLKGSSPPTILNIGKSTSGALPSGTSPSASASTSSGALQSGMSQNEVLANFFQSLLSKKGSSATGANSPPAVTSSGSNIESGSPGTQRRIVEKELERLRNLGSKS